MNVCTMQYKYVLYDVVVEEIIFKVTKTKRFLTLLLLFFKIVSAYDLWMCSYMNSQGGRRL